MSTRSILHDAPPESNGTLVPCPSDRLPLVGNSGILGAMLVVTRKRYEKVVILTENGERIEVSIARIGFGYVRLGIEAPDSVGVYREELLEDPDGSEVGM